MDSRKRKAVSLETKRTIVKLIESKKRTQVDITREFGLSKSTVNTIWKDREKYAAKNYSFGNDNKRLRKATFNDIEDALLLWLKQARTCGVPVGGPLLKEKANQLAIELGHEGFACSDGWLDRFKKRREVTFRMVSGEANSVPKNIVDDFLHNKLPKLLEEYEPKDIFNADETGLFFKLLPDRTYTFKGDTCHGGKKSKERITLMIAANMDGTEKLPLLAIGKSAKPQCFKNVKNLPVEYKSNKKAWMTGGIFTEWVTKLDRKFSRENRKVLLIVDNCSAHDQDIATKLKSIKLEFLPPNCTSRLQPCDMGIIKNFKVLYRKRLLSKLIRSIEERRKEDFTVNVLECLRWSKSVWDDGVTQQTIANCFRKAGFQKELSNSQSDTEIDDARNESLTNFFDHLVDLQYIGSNDNDLLSDFISSSE